MGCILFTNGKSIGHQHILVGEIFTIRETVVAIIQNQLSHVIIESDLLTAIQTIGGESNPPGQIRNLVKDINILVNVVKNIEFVYFSSSSNE